MYDVNALLFRYALLACLLNCVYGSKASSGSSDQKHTKPNGILKPIANGRNKTALNEMEVSEMIAEMLSCNGSDNELTHPKFPGYYDHEEMTEILQNYTKDYPSISRLYSIGKSVREKDLWVMEISNDIRLNETSRKPAVKLVANIHGNEATGYALLLMLTEFLLKNYNQSECIRKLVSSMNIHILPSMNPDGFARAVEGDIYSKHGRFNAKGVDLNRNFPDRLGVTETNAVQEPETQAVMKWSLENNFILSVSFHGVALVATYPYDGTINDTDEYSKSPDDDVFRQIALSYSKAHKTMALGNGCPRNPDYAFKDGISNGAAWYSLKGGMQDWNYVFANTFELTVEVSCWKYPPYEQMAEHWNSNHKALISFLLEALKGIEGVVLDVTKRPIAGATISVESIKHDVKSNRDGSFRRLLAPGNYTITVSKKGYYKASRVVTVNENRPATSVDFTLKRNMAENIVDDEAEPKKSSAPSFLGFSPLYSILLCVLFLHVQFHVEFISQV